MVNMCCLDYGKGLIKIQSKLLEISSNDKDACNCVDSLKERTIIVLICTLDAIACRKGKVCSKSSPSPTIIS